MTEEIKIRETSESNEALVSWAALLTEPSSAFVPVTLLSISRYIGAILTRSGLTFTAQLLI
jgi:hypothetical protein